MHELSRACKRRLQQSEPVSLFRLKVTLPHGEALFKYAAADADADAHAFQLTIPVNEQVAQMRGLSVADMLGIRRGDCLLPLLPLTCIMA